MRRTETGADADIDPLIEHDPEGTHPENLPIRQDLTPMLTGQGEHAEFRRRGLSAETCAELGIGFLGVGRSVLRNRIVFQIRGAHWTGGEVERAVLSHIGYSAEGSPRWKLYDGFLPSLELYGQDSLAFDPAAREQVQATGSLLVLADPFEVAKAHEIGLRNAVSPPCGPLCDDQVKKLARLYGELSASEIRLVFPRDEVGRVAGFAAAKLVEAHGLTPRLFDWDAPVGRDQRGAITIPETIRSLGDMTPEQIRWLRERRFL